jgi:two-component system NtrC family sensor kinase
MSLRTKMILSIFAFLVLVFGLATLNLWLDAAQRTRAEARRHADLVARMVGDLSRAWTARFPAGSGEAWVELSRRLSASELVAAWVVAERLPDGFTVVAGSGSRTEDPVPEESAIFQRALEGVEVSADGGTIWMPLLMNDGRRAVARLEIHGIPSQAAAISGVLRSIVVVMALGIVLILLNMVVLLHRMVLRPLDRLVEASGRVAAGDFSQKIPGPSAYDEMGRMVSAFNLMMERISGEQRRLQDDVKTARISLGETERQLFAAQRLSTTGTLAAGVAHEINNPLGGMINAARALQEGRLDPAKREEYLQLLLEGLERVRAIVQKMLQFRARPFEPRDLDLRGAVEQAIAFVAHRSRAKGVEVENLVPADLPPLKADPVEFPQALLNLLVNAVDACVHGEGRVKVNCRREPGALAVEVEDDGCGMDPEELGRCLDPFYTTKDPGEGTGLGLSVAHNIVTNHGGKFDIQSHKGRGTRVTLTLPCGGGAKKVDPSLGGLG